MARETEIKQAAPKKEAVKTKEFTMKREFQGIAKGRKVKLGPKGERLFNQAKAI